MHEIDAKQLLSAQGGMNLCRGCLHGCIYCDARSECYQISHPFEDIALKRNAPALLEDFLRRRRAPCMIATGAMSDPYLPLEPSLALTRQCLTLIADYGFGVTMQTKSTRVLRDLPLFARIQAQTKAVVQMTLTTLDDNLCKIVEPNVEPTSERLAALRTLRDAGIPTVVWISPILPWINDTPENIGGLVDACAAAGVYGILYFGAGLTLRAGNREYYYTQLDRHFPGLRERYERRYGLAYELPSPDAARLDRLFYEKCRAYGIVCDNRALFGWLRAFEDKRGGKQLALF